jgi:hypothetical protein
MNVLNSYFIIRKAQPSVAVGGGGSCINNINM